MMPQSRQNPHSGHPVALCGLSGLGHSLDYIKPVCYAAPMTTTQERFRKGRKQKNQSSEGFGNKSGASERKSDHTLTVRDAQVMLKKIGVGVTERTIVNWCHLNAEGYARLDAWKDSNDGMWYISPSSVEFVAAEERNKLIKQAQTIQPESHSVYSETGKRVSEKFGNEQNGFGGFPNASEEVDQPKSEQRIKKLEAQNRDLEIANRVKDQYIEHQNAQVEKLIDRLEDRNYQIGKLEGRFHQLEAPRERGDHMNTKTTRQSTGDDANQNEKSENVATE